MTLHSTGRSPRGLSRRTFLATGVAALALPGLSAAAATPRPAASAAGADGGAQPGQPESGAPFSYDWLVGQARTLAGKPYEPAPASIPEVLAELNYDEHRDIRYRPDHGLWRGVSPYEVQFFHLGSYFDRPVRVFDVSDGTSRPVAYDAADFDMGRNRFEPPLPDGLGFAGLRVHYPLNDPQVLDELLTFLGASYFRVLGKGNRYGLSSRGVAINTGLPEGEEFPSFTRFYLERPAERNAPLRIYAMLDGPSLAGAYRFEVMPGAPTMVDVTARLFLRETVERLGLAPLTSMFEHGPADPKDAPDYRPRVHDSQGLLMHTGGDEWIWRPLRNPDGLALSAFQDTAPKGFGLMQRVRTFDDYEDLEARYDLRPSLWIEPRGDWGKGSVMLMELPTPDETHDNIVAFWNPDEPAEAGAALTLRYAMHWGMDGPRQPLAHVHQTRLGRGGVPGKETEDGQRKVVIDFVGGPLEELPPDAELTVLLQTNGIETSEAVVQPNPVTNGQRVFFDLPEPGERAAELRCRLMLDDTPVSETWSFQWS